MASSTELAIERLRRNQKKLKAKLDQLHKEFNSSDSVGKDVSIVVGRSPYLTRKRARTKMLTPDNVRLSPFVYIRYNTAPAVSQVYLLDVLSKNGCNKLFIWIKKH